MKFEDKFPNLKNYMKTVNEKGKEIPLLSLLGDKLFSSAEIQETCIDNAKVREVVTAYLCKYVCKDDRIRKLRDGILKELEL